MNRKMIKSYGLVLIGCIIQAFVISCILKPNDLVGHRVRALDSHSVHVHLLRNSAVHFVICVLGTGQAGGEAHCLSVADVSATAHRGECIEL